MILEPINEYVLRLSSSELRVVCKALGQRLSEEDVPVALALDRSIAEMRVTLGENAYKSIAKLKENLSMTSN